MPVASRETEQIIITPGQQVVLVRSPAQSYAGRPGQQAVVTDVSHGAVHVQFRSLLRECYPDGLFRQLFHTVPPGPLA